MEGWKCPSVAESKPAPDPESDTEPAATEESGSAPNFNTKLEYQSTYESTSEPKSTFE